MKGIVWGSDEFINKIKQSEKKKDTIEMEEYVRNLIENGATKKDVDKLLGGL